jgi:hypothetical protein
MLPTFSGRATHLRTLTPSLAYAKHSGALVGDKHFNSDGTPLRSSFALYIQTYRDLAPTACFQ